MDIKINTNEIEDSIYRKSVHFKYKPTFFNKNCLRSLNNLDTLVQDSDKKITKICFKESSLLPKNVYVVPKNQDSDILEDEILVVDFIKKTQDDSDSESESDSDSESFVESEEDGYVYDENDEISEFSE